VIVNELRSRHGRVYGTRVVVLVGPGANGGDAMFAAARLAARGVAVTAVMTSARPHEAGLAALEEAGARIIDIVRRPAAAALAEPDLIEDAEARRLMMVRKDGAAGRAWSSARMAVAAADLVVDGLLGIGGRPGLIDPAAGIVHGLDPRVPVIAVDLPSGINPDTGALIGTHIKADVTVTFGTPKPALLLPPSSHVVGRLIVADIGLEVADVARLWPVPRYNDDKYSRGVVGVVAGGSVYSGAAVLAAGAAVRSGAGMTRFVGPDPVTRAVRERWPEVVPGEGRVQAWVLGPGVDPDSDDDQAKAILSALEGEVPCVVDAGGLDVLNRALADGGSVTAPMLLTPHAGELARFVESRTDRKRVDREMVLAQPVEFARIAAETTGATVLLKGATTIVVGPEGPVRSQAEAPAWLATAGAGDVLSGVIGALLAAGLDPIEAGSLGAWVHGRAAETASAGGPITAEDVLAAVPGTVAELLKHRR
jgi:hydroxyethylthiazole kinase-like uncharacterized protein yjeF